MMAELVLEQAVVKTKMILLLVSMEYYLKCFDVQADGFC